MSFSTEWESIYHAGQQQTAWPWSDLVSYVHRYGPRPLKGCRVLELGCGVGANAAFFLAVGAEYWAVEGSRSAISVLLKRYPTLQDRIMAADFTADIPVPGSFELVVDRASVTHNETAAISRTLAEVRRRLKPGGRYIGIDWFSSRHTDRRLGRPELDDHTYAGFTGGQFQGVGRVHLSDEAHLRKLFADFRLLALEHKDTRNHLAQDEQVVATWNIAAEVP